MIYEVSLAYITFHLDFDTLLDATGFGMQIQSYGLQLRRKH